MKKIAAVSFLWIAFLSSNVSAGLLGETVNIEWFYPDNTTVLTASGNVTVGAGVEWNPGYGLSSIDISDNTLIIQNDTSGWTGAGFNGFVISDALGLIDDFTSFSLTSANGLDYAADLTFGADFLSVNFTPLSLVNYQTNGTYVFSFTTTSSVSEPSILVLFGVGLAGFGVVARRKRQKA